jgi:predicted dehydrogenase
MRGSNNRLKVGIIGTGYISEYHAEGYLEIPEKVEIVATCDAVESLAREKMISWGAKRYYTDYNDLFKHEELDIVDICLPHHLHKDAVIKAAEAGMNIILEKPIARTMEEAEEMIKSVKKAGVKFMVSYNERFLPHHQEAKMLLEKGVIGKLKMITGSLYGTLPSETLRGWRGSKEKSGGGVLIDSGGHRVDLMRWMAGEVDTLFCQTSRVLFEEYEAEDTAFLLMNFKNGAIGQLNVSWGVKGALWTANWNETLMLCGTKGTIVCDNLTNSLMVYSDELPEDFKSFVIKRYWTNYFESIKSAVKHFVDCVINDKMPLISGEDGKAVLQIILRAYESAEKGKVLKV